MEGIVRQQSEVMIDVESIKSSCLKVCIFGCGAMGKGIGYDILKFLELEVVCYCDNDITKWGKEIKDGIKCCSPDTLSKMEHIACVIMASLYNQEKIREQLEKYHISVILTYHELVALDIVINRFLEVCAEKRCILDDAYDEKHKLYIPPFKNEQNKQYAVYTCITGGYDQVVEPQYYTDECDYYLISDNRPENLEIFKWIDANEIVPDYVKDNVRRNRFCKIHAPHIFSQYRYSVYVDGNIQIMGDVRKYIKNIGKSGIAVHKLPSWDDLYAHVLNNIRRDKVPLIFAQMNKYHKEGMPRHYGMFECTMLVRDNIDPVCKKIMDDWWQEVFHYSYRDQFSFTYCLWKNGVEAKDVGILGNNYRENSDFRRAGNHHRKDSELK